MVLSMQRLANNLHLAAYLEIRDASVGRASAHCKFLRQTARYKSIDWLENFWTYLEACN
jgi:hypothetical protein